MEWLIINKSALKRATHNYPECQTFSNIKDSLKRNFDAYIVSTPPNTHYNIAKIIIDNKKHVLVEKPITLNLADAISLNDLAKANKVNLMVGHLLLFHPAFIKIKELIDKGLLGKIQYIYSNRLNLGSFRSDENVLWSFAPHDIALFNYFFDDVPDEIITNGLDILQKEFTIQPSHRSNMGKVEWDIYLLAGYILLKSTGLSLVQKE